MRRCGWLVLPMLALAGCNGRVTLAVTDAPVDSASNVTVQFTGVEFERSDGRVERFDFSTPKNVNLLALEGGQRSVLLDEGLPTQDYRSIRLEISADGSGTDSFIVLADGTHALELAAEDQGRLKLSRSFSLAASDDLAFTVDFDLRRSIHEPSVSGEPHRLIPELRMVQDADAGALAGSVAASRIVTDCVPAVYVYSGNGVAPDDVGGNTEPLNTARVLQNASGGFTYRVGLLPEGAYTAAFTCQADDDDPGSDDAITFDAQSNASVEAGGTATADF